MAKSTVSICNLALSWLGVAPITALTDDTDEARLCSRLYDYTRDAVLEATDWTFAMKRTTLTPEAVTPAFGYSYQFIVPSTHLRNVTVSDDVKRPSENTLDWVQEDNRILCDATKIYVRYISQVTDPTKFSSQFMHALAARLAMDMAIPLTESRSLADAMVKLYQSKLSGATSSDGRQGRTQRIRNSSLTRNR